MNLHIRLFIGVLMALTMYCGVAKAQITVTSVTPNPVCAGFATTVSYTNSFTGSATLSVYLYGTNPADSTLLIQTTTNGGNGSVIPTIPGNLSTGTYTIGIKRTTSQTAYVSPRSNGLTVNAIPPVPTVTDVPYCLGTPATSLSATAIPGGTLSWYTAQTGGPAFSSITPSTASAGTTPYYVSQTVNGCEGPRVVQNVNVNSLPAKPTVVMPTPYCQNATAVALSASAPGRLSWYTSPNQPAGTGSAMAPTPPTITVGSTRYYVSQKDINGCESDRADILVTVKTRPTPPLVSANPVVYCQNDPAVPVSATLTVNGGTLNWYDRNNALAGAPIPPTSSPGDIPYFVSQTADGCESDKSSLLVTINPKPVPPATTSVPVCQNTPPVSLATGIVTATGTLKWYTVQSGGTGSTVTPTPSTTAVGSTTYYVSQTDGKGCESDRAILTFTVNAYPAAPTVSPSSLTYCQGAVVAPLAATPVTNATLNWYYAATGGTRYDNLTPSNTTSNNYYVSQTLNGCESQQRATISVSINAMPPRPLVVSPAPVYCQKDLAIPLSATAITNNTLYWYGTDATGGTASTQATKPSTDNAGLINYYVSQKDPIGCESDRAPILVTVNPKPTPPVIDPPSACQNSSPGPLTAAVTATGTLKWYSTQTGGTGSAVTPVPSTSAVGQTTYYVSQTSDRGCESDRAALVFTVNPLPAAPTVTARTLFYCQNVTALPLTASAPGILKWYTTRTGGTPLANLIPATTFAVVTTYYVSQTDGNVCEGARDSVTVTVSSRPAPPRVTPSGVYCQNDVPVSLSATPLSNNTLNWYGTSASGGTASSVATTPSTDNAGVTPYYVSQTDGNGCESDRASIPVTVNARPAAPVTVPVPLCQNSTPGLLTAAVTATGTLTWYTAQTGGTGSTTTPVLSTSAVGTTTYYVSQTDGNRCESTRSAILVTVKPLPTAPVVSPNPLLLCQSSVAAPLTAMATGTLKWYDPAGNTFSSITPSTDVVAPTVYKVSQIVDGCEGPTASLTVIVIRKPDAPAVVVPAPYCQFAPPASLSATGQNLLWYTAPTGGSSSMTAPPLSTDLVGTTIYYVSQTDANGCESSRAIIPVQVKMKPNPPRTAPISFCANQTVPLAATFATGSTPNWYGTNATGGTPTSTAPTPTTTVIGAPVSYYVSQTVDGCESDRASIAVTIKALPVAPSVSATPVVYCQAATAVALSATAAAGGTLLWYATQTGGTASVDAPIPQTLSSNPATTYYYVGQTVDGCEGPRATIAVTVNPKPTRPTVVASLTYCQNMAAPVLSAAATGTLYWYMEATGGTAIPAPTPQTTNPGVTTYYVNQVDVNGCVSDRASVTITVIATPVAPVTAPISFCQNAVTSLTATPGPGGSLNWYSTPTGGAPSSVAPIPPSSVAGTIMYYVSQSINGCEGPRASLTVTINSLPTAPLVSTNPINLCQNSQPTTLTAVAATGGTLNWYTVPTGGVPTAIAPIVPTSVAGTIMYYVSQSINNCEGPRTAITVTIRSVPVAPGVSTSPLTFCQGTVAAALTAIPANGGTLNWYGNNPGSIPTAVAPLPATTTPGVSTYYVSQIVAGCESPQASIVVLVQATPAAPTVGAAPIYCLGGAATALSAVATGGGSLNWYTTPTGGTASTTPPVPPVTTSGTVTYYVTQSINGCEGPRVSLTATIKPLPTAPAATASLAYCQGVIAPALAATAGGGTLNWYTVPTGGTATPVAPVPPTSVAGTTAYYVSQTDANGCESTRTPISVKINALPAAPTTTPGSFCQGTVATMLVANGTSLNWYMTQMGGTASPMAPTPVTTSAGVLTYYVSQTDASSCESTRSLLLVTITPTPAAPAVAAIAPVCQNAPPIVLSAAGQGLKWYADATTTTSLGSSVIQATAQAGTFAYYVSQTVNLCESARSLVQVVVNALPAAPTVSNQNGCQDTPAQSLTATGTALQWFDASENQIGPPTPVTKVESIQTYTYKVTQTISGCTSPKATLTYTVNVTPPPAVVSPVAYCQNTMAKPLQATGTSLKWYDPAGSVTTVAPTPPTAVGTAGSSYSVTQTSPLGCESRKAEVRVAINTLSTAKLDGTTTVNLGSSAILSLTLSGMGPYSYTLSDGTTGTAETSTTETTVRKIPITPGVTTTYTVTAVSNACGSGTTTGTATVSVRVPTIITSALATSVICSGASITIPFTTTGEFTLGNAFTVEIASATGDTANRKYIPISNGVVQGPSIATTIPVTVAQGLYYVRVSASNTSFPISGSRSPTQLMVRALPTAALTVAKRAIYKGENAELAFTLSGDAPWTVNYSSGSELRSIASTTSLYNVVLTPAVTTTYKLLSVSNICGLGKIEGVDTVTIRVDVLTAELDPFSNAVTVYPVPTEGSITVDIDLPLHNEPAQLQVVDFKGRISKQTTTRQRQTTVQLENEPAGTYLLYIKVGNQSTVRKILKR